MTVGITELPPEGMQLPGVVLAGDPERGTKTTEGISLLFTTAGVTVQGPQPQIERLLVWSALDSATCRERIQLPDGRDAAIMELTSGGQSIRFLLPNDTVSPGQAAYLDQALPAWLLRYKGVAAPTPAAPAPSAADASGPEIGVALPPPGPTAPAAAETPAQAVETPAPAMATATATTAGAVGATALSHDPTAAAPQTPLAPRAATAPPVMQAPPMAAPPAPPAPAAPGLQAPPPPPAPAAPGLQAPPPPPPPAPAAPSMQESPPSPPAAPPPAPAPSAVAPDGWDGLSYAPAAPSDPAPGKKPRFALTRKKLREAEAASATAAMVTAPPAQPPADVVQPANVAPTSGEPTPAKKPRFALTRRQLRAAEAAAAADAGPAAPAQPAGLHDTASAAPPQAAPVDPVPLAVQPPPPSTSTGGPAEGLDGPAGTPPGADGVVLAGAAKKPGHRGLIALIVVLVLVVAGGAYVISRRSPSPSAVAPTPAPAASGASDTVLAGSINLRLADLPTGWSTTAPGQAVVRPPVAPAVSQAAALNTMASCLDTSYAVASGLFAAGSLPGQTSLVQSPVFQSAAGPSFEMSSRTTVLSSAGQVQALEGVFTNPNFDSCFQQFHQSLATGAAAGATVAVQPVTLAAPKGVTTYGVVSTYTIPGAGTQVVGDAYLLGGRVVTIIEPWTSGAAIPSSVFAPAYGAVANRVAAAAAR